MMIRRRQDPASVLAENLLRIVTASGAKSVRGFAGEPTLARAMSRIIKKEHSPSIELLEEIAAKAGNLQAWHLLVPGLDPKNPPKSTDEPSIRQNHTHPEYPF